MIKLNKSRSRRRRKQKEAQRKKINNNKTNNQKINNKKIIVIFAIIIVIAILAYLLKSDTYNIKQVEIEGNVEITKEEAISLSDIKVGQNIFLTSELVTKVKMKENGYIEDVKLKKVYPNKIEIQLTERKKDYQILTETGSYIYIDEQGHILQTSTTKADLKTITGMSISEEQAKQLKRLEQNDLDKMEKILHIKAENEKIGIEQNIVQIDVENEYVLHYKDDSIIINLGDAEDLSEKMFYVKAILKEEKDNSGTVYVNGNINEGFAPYFSAK